MGAHHAGAGYALVRSHPLFRWALARYEADAEALVFLALGGLEPLAELADCEASLLLEGLLGADGVA